MTRWWLACGKSELVLPQLDFPVDALVTDPPAAIRFMGRAWDSNKGGRSQWIAWLAGILAECHRLMRPGAHAFVWVLPRTAHWTMTAVEDAGFEVRDVVVHLFGSGFPKSLDVSKAIDDAAGVDRIVVGERSARRLSGHLDVGSPTIPTTIPTTPEAARWSGYGTAVKPASEHWILARKPLDSTVAGNVLTHGTGALNIDGCRVPAIAGDRTEYGIDGDESAGRNRSCYSPHNAPRTPYARPDAGRFPPNVLLTHDFRCNEVECWHECPARMLDEQSGDRPGMSGGGAHRDGYAGGMFGGIDSTDTARSDSGGASRFFPRFRYIAKPSSAERDLGLWDFEPQRWSDGRTAEHDTPRLRAGKGRRNSHPTVKSIELMRWLVRLITPPGGLVLDPFTGSGTTGCAALIEGHRFAGITDEEEHAEIARARIATAACERPDPGKQLGNAPVKIDSRQTALFASGQR